MVAIRGVDASRKDNNHASSTRHMKISFLRLVLIVILSSSLISPTSAFIAINTTNSLGSETTANATTTNAPSISQDNNKEEDVEKNTMERPFRILYMVTALSDYNNGSRATIRGQDRLKEQLLPVLLDGIHSLISPPYNFEVDVYLLLGWKLLPERRRIIEDALPEGVGLQIWDDAKPYDYEHESHTEIRKLSRALPRQQRYVLKDKIDFYDFFISFEDDMRISGQHVEHFLGMSEELRILTEEAPEKLNEVPEEQNAMKQRFYGNMTKSQVVRLIPGFIRVEALVNETRWPAQNHLDPIPVDLQFPVVGNDGETLLEERKVDPTICCQSQYSNTTILPQNPDTDTIILWETAVHGAVVRQLPKGANNLLDWVLLQPGPSRMTSEKFIGGYWSGRVGAYGKADKPKPEDPKLFAQQGGWMATRKQLIDIHENHCGKRFFPPFELPTLIREGLKWPNVTYVFGGVEYWSGGYQMFSGEGEFPVKPERLVKANHFYGQVNSVVKAAQREMYFESIDAASE